MTIVYSSEFELGSSPIPPKCLPQDDNFIKYVTKGNTVESFKIKKYTNVKFDAIADYSRSHTNDNIKNIQSVSVTNTKFKYNQILPICALWGSSWQHFMQDIFSVLCYIRDFLAQNPDIVILTDRPQFDYASLFEKAQIKNKICFYSKFAPSVNISCKELYRIICKPTYPVCGLPSSMFRSVSDALGNLKTENPPNSLVYISRKKCAVRKIKNEDAVIEFLKEYAESQDLKFVYFDPPGKNIDENYKIFNDAKIVIAPHGGANYHIYFCRPSTKFIEICFIADDKNIHSLSGISAGIGLDYYFLTIDVSHYSEGGILQIDNLRQLIDK